MLVMEFKDVGEIRSDIISAVSMGQKKYFIYTLLHRIRDPYTWEEGWSGYFVILEVRRKNTKWKKKKVWKDLLTFKKKKKKGSKVCTLVDVV